MDAARALPGGKTDLSLAVPEAGLMPGSDAMPLHPHNAILQWEVELGVPGALLALAIVLWGLWSVAFAARLSRAARAGALAWAATTLVIASLAYGAWQAWWLSCVVLTSALLIASDEA
jgi:exopolysaccharide production protein ExoQ